MLAKAVDAIGETRYLVSPTICPKPRELDRARLVLTNAWRNEERKNLAARMEKDLPVARTGESERISAAAVSLMMNPYITGVVLPVDGGLLLN